MLEMVEAWFTAKLDLQRTVPRLQPFQASDINGKHVLAVDDSPIDRMILEGMLKSWGIPHTSAESAQRALALTHQAAAARKTFDLAIIDWMMPGMNGDELGRAIKNDAVLHHMKMVMCTSETQPELRHRLKAMGFDAYLTKPVGSNQLMNCLRLVLCPRPDPCPEAPRPQGLITDKAIEAERLNAPNILVEDHLECLDAGMNDYLPKPVNPRKLVEKIKHWHQKHHKCMATDSQGNN